MNIKKPNSFARYGDNYVAPLTTIDQIVKPSGERYTDREFELMSNIENVMFGGNCAGKNLLNPTLQTTTINGVTYTNNGDGTYTLNGTATGDASVMIGTISLPSGNYKLVGCPSGGSTETFNLRIGKTQSSAYYGNEVGSGLNLIGDGYYTISINAVNGFTCNNLVFKPMITDDLEATYDDFEPYIKSLRQLTDSALNMDLLWTNASPTSSFSPQTISLDLSNYIYIYCSFRNYAPSSEIVSYLFKKDFRYVLNNADVRRTNRYVQITPDSFISEDAYIYPKYNDESGKYIDNLILVPYQIYGVR